LACQPRPTKSAVSHYYAPSRKWGRLKIAVRPSVCLSGDTAAAIHSVERTQTSDDPMSMGRTQWCHFYWTGLSRLLARSRRTQNNSIGNRCMYCTRWFIKSYICDHNCEKLIFKNNFCTAVSRKNIFTHTRKASSPHLNNVLTLPCENEWTQFFHGRDVVTAARCAWSATSRMTNKRTSFSQISQQIFIPVCFQFLLGNCRM